MRVALAYSPRPGPLGAASPLQAALFLGPLAAIAFIHDSPFVLVGTAVAALWVASLSQALDALRAPLRWALALGVLIVAVNALAAQRGETILLRGWDLPLLGQLDVSLEALVEGGVLALRVLVALLVFAVWSACVNPDRILRGIRPYAARSALTGTLIARLVPLAAADLQRLSETARLRGPAASELGRMAIARRLLAGSLDRAIDVAATLELRGYGLDTSATQARPRTSAGGSGLVLAGVAIAAVGIVAAIVGVAGFDAYPTISIATGPGALALAGAIPLLAAAPFLASTRAGRSAVSDVG